MVLRFGIRDHGHITQVGHLGQAGLHPILHVKVCRTAAAPVKRGGPGDAAVLHVLDQRLDGRKARARGQQHHGLVAVFTQVKTAIRAFGAQDVLFFHGGEHRVGELAAGHVADVQFHRGWCHLQGVRRVRHAVAAARTIAQQKFDVLTSVKLHHIVGGQLQFQHNHIVRFLLQSDHAHRHLLDGQAAFGRDLF